MNYDDDWGYVREDIATPALVDSVAWRFLMEEFC